MKKENNMKLFVYKTLFVFFMIYILFKVTIGYKIDEYEKKISNFKSDQGRELIRNKVREEIKKSIERDSLFDPEDKILIKKFIEKAKEELQ
tara:strand:+ start:80 stop:352 length:273 start_codon:yes stop_codon:yes gene_type:complete